MRPLGQWVRGLNRPEKIVFLGGAPRSGTTVAHALLCSAPGVGRFHPEIAFFRGAVSAYATGRTVWDQHTSAFFSDPADFRRVISETASVSLDHVWQAVEKPPILCVKDPHLTPLFPALNEVLPDALFVTVCRHPYDVVRSRQEVFDKLGVSFDLRQALGAAREYLHYYRQVLGHGFAGRHFIFRYEDLNVEPMRTALAAFIDVPGFDTSRMWLAAQDDGGRPAEGTDQPWASPKSFGPIDLGRRLDPIPADWQAAVKSVCEPIMTHMGYA